MIAAAWAWFAGSKLGRWIIAAGAVVLAIGGALLLGRRQGRQAQEREQEAEDHEAYRDAVDTRNRIEDRIRRAGDGTAADELRKRWSRD
ncbi:hypothetical protein FFK22_026710 [Mycobacterium sp. KBS0706]|uniref:DUF2905 domain-containing protein n=1 Tax=Mycobacterium sp. KBS0706 TaxID=2578109 RepID=UPI00110F95F0|nr:DUF2905 domain-containing protein [Mycobacterium sp. KBS0706]TSD85639.1 hypothetical protein FFK22_026710 [Mycobacterium sp. KBS0706]